jgi:SAM-dependent methyltransferase
MVCRICNNATHNLDYEVIEMMYGTRERFDYFRCSACGCLQIAEIPTDIGKYYPRNYYSYSSLDESRYKGLYGAFKLKKFQSAIFSYSLFNRIFHSLFKAEYQYDIFREMRLDLDCTILDVGTGNGEFLYPLEMMGFKNVLGIDPFREQDIEYSNGLRVKKKTIFDISSKWDMIIYNNVFEHLQDPKKELNHIAEILNADGTCILTVPTIDSYAWHKYGTSWYQIDAPRHFYLHSLRSMEILADEAGLMIDKVRYNSIYTQFFYSELYQAGIPMRERPKINLLHKPAWKWEKFKFNRLASRLNKRNMGDMFVVYLKKKV